MGLNGALQIGRSAMLSSQAAISVTGNNLANAATPGYHRQIAGLTPNGSSPIGRNQFVGTGVALSTLSSSKGAVRELIGPDLDDDADRSRMVAGITDLLLHGLLPR